MKIKAVNNFVLVKRDEAPKKAGVLDLPESKSIKPHSGVILSVGKMVKDADVKGGVGRRILYHETTGFGISYEEMEYWVLNGEDIISIV